MNVQERVIDTRIFRIAVIAIAAAIVLALAAYLFGTGIRADTSASVAPSPLGSSLTDTRQALAAAPSILRASSVDTRGARTIASAERAAALGALEKSAANFHADQSNSALPAKAAAMAAGDKELAVFNSAVNDANAAATAAKAASLAALERSAAGFHADQSNSALAAKAAALAALEKSAAGFHADQSNSALPAKAAAMAAGDKELAVFNSGVIATNAAVAAAKAAALAPLSSGRGDIYEYLRNSSAAADAYQNEWMGFSSPESVAAKASVASGAAADASTSSIKPEGIKATGADPATGGSPWLKPEGINASK